LIDHHRVANAKGVVPPALLRVRLGEGTLAATPAWLESRAGVVVSGSTARMVCRRRGGDLE